MLLGTEPTTGFTPSSRQRDAIEAALGPLLVLAGPGAGKTFCLIERIRFLIEAQGFDPARICAVTFTNKAAQEIAERLEKALGQRSQGLTGGTLHALCAGILREHGELIGVRRGFGIADEEYQKDVLRRLGVWRDKRRAWLLTRFGLYRAKDVPLVPQDLAVFNRYRLHLEQRNLLDFDDLVVRTAELLAAHEAVADEVAARWDYLLVDEFQDLNPRQYAVVRRLARAHRNLFVVGDDEQSVYSWTGADPQVLRQFANDFQLDRVVVLDENRRTAREIFAAARRLLRNNPPLFEEKVLRAERESEHGVSVLGFDDERAEARWLLADLRADQRGSGLPWGEYGVLYRRHEIGDTLEAELLREGIPCRLAAGRALQDDPVVRYLVAALRVIADPADPLRQEAFAREVLPSPVWSRVVSEAERQRQEPLAWMRTLARRAVRDDEDAKKLRRADYALQNLPALARRHETLAGLVEELLSQRVGTYRTVLEDLHDELSDPASDLVVAALARRLAGALHGRKRVWLPRAGGLELALSGLLLRAGVTAFAYLDGGETPRADDLIIAPEEGGRSGLGFGLFKALQLVHAGALRDAFRDFVAVDLETTDRDTASCDIVELGAVRVR
ncbi:MAG TPA: UvrD-helicase domain-containing protein, partial [Gemmatimonadales bacterium]|nr:UvrD-helicase domain-containing protein [Gemmatimonadales bacterium]